MKKILLLLAILIFNFSLAQLNESIIGKWNLKVTVTTDFTDTETAVSQAKTNAEKYAYLDGSNWNFKKEGILEVKLKDGTIEKANYSANENRFIIIFEKEDVEEFNTTNVLVHDKSVEVSMGRGMTKLIFNFSKK